MANNIIRFGKIGKGFYAGSTYEPGDVIEVEEPQFTSHTCDGSENGIQPIRHNNKFAWSLVDRMLNECTVDLNAQIDEWVELGHTQNKGSSVWDTGDDLALVMVSGATDIDDGTLSMVRQMYNMVVTMCNTTLVTSVRRDGHLDDPARVYGFYPRFSFVNHACRPTAAFDPPRKGEEGTRVLTALRHIQAGNEITVNYMAPQRVLFNLRPLLLELFGFRCACKWCMDLCTNIICNNRGKRNCSCYQVKYCGRTCQKLDHKRHWVRHKAAKKVQTNT